MWLQQERSVENNRTPKSFGIDQCMTEFGYGNEKSWDSLENVMLLCLFLYKSSFLGGYQGFFRNYLWENSGDPSPSGAFSNLKDIKNLEAVRSSQP